MEITFTYWIVGSVVARVNRATISLHWENIGHKIREEWHMKYTESYYLLYDTIAPLWDASGGDTGALFMIEWQPDEPGIDIKINTDDQLLLITVKMLIARYFSALTTFPMKKINLNQRSVCLKKVINLNFKPKFLRKDDQINQK